MSDVLIFIESKSGKVSKGSLAALTAAQEICSKWNLNGISGIVLGKDAKAVAENALEYGLDQVFYNSDLVFEKFLAVTYSHALIEALNLSNAKILVMAASSSGKDVSARVAGKLGIGQASDVIGINNDKTFRRPMYAGNAFADFEILTDKKVITVRTSSFAEALTQAKQGSISLLEVTVPNSNSEVVSYEFPETSRPELSSAEVVVSGGRALDSAENFEKYIFPLADALGAAVGASRAAVDSGYAPNDWQVGQTGKVVAPKLYVAVGISGAIQHLAGMKDSKVIVAINKDPEAAIFEVADYGLVADLYQALPILIDGIKKAKA